MNSPKALISTAWKALLTQWLSHTYSSVDFPPFPTHTQYTCEHHVEMFYRTHSRKLCLAWYIIFIVYFSKRVSAFAVFILSRCEQSALCLSLLKENFEMSFLLKWPSISTFFCPWVRRWKPPVPAHVPSGEGSTISSAFQECLWASWVPRARTLMSWRCDPDPPEAFPWTDL